MYQAKLIQFHIKSDSKKSCYITTHGFKLRSSTAIVATM